MSSSSMDPWQNTVCQIQSFIYAVISAFLKIFFHRPDLNGHFVAVLSAQSDFH